MIGYEEIIVLGNLKRLSIFGVVVTQVSRKHAHFDLFDGYYTDYATFYVPKNYYYSYFKLGFISVLTILSF